MPDALAMTDGVVRTIGGIQYEGYSAIRETPFQEKKHVQWAEKEAIAAKACELVQEGDIVGLTGGSTTFFIARKLKEMRNITIVTNAVNIAMELADGEELQVVLTGGVMRSKSYELCGPLAEKTLEGVNISKMFLGVDGFTLEQGFTMYSELEANIGKLMIKRSAMTIAVCDGSKFGRASLFTVASCSEVNACITNEPVEEGYANQLAEQKVMLYVPRSESNSLNDKS